MSTRQERAGRVPQEIERRRGALGLWAGRLLVGSTLLLGGVTYASGAPARAAGACTVALGGSIQQAVDDLSCAIISVAGGTFKERVRINRIDGSHVEIDGAAEGTPTVVDGGKAGTVFNIAGGQVTLTRLTIVNGTVGSAPAGGGGIFNQGRLFLIDSTVSQNFAGLGNSGGGIFNLGQVTLTHSTVRNNHAGSTGGGIENQGKLTLEDSTLSGNTAGVSGGGILNAATSQLTMRNSTLSANMAVVSGGGIFNSTSNGSLTMVNCTLQGNSATYGGGMLNDNGSSNVTLVSSTLSGNSDGVFNSGTLDLSNSLVAGNGTPASPADIVGNGKTINDGHNIVGLIVHDKAYTLSQILATDGSGNPILRDNGGPTRTIALVEDSPALDAVPVAACKDTSGQPLATDQRGVSRPQGRVCDIGAFEKVTPSGLCTSTLQDIQTSANFQALSIQQKAAVMGLAQPLCEEIATVVPTISPARKAQLVVAYQRGVQALVAPGWLTQDQGTLLAKISGDLLS